MKPYNRDIQHVRKMNLPKPEQREIPATFDEFMTGWRAITSQDVKPGASGKASPKNTKMSPGSNGKRQKVVLDVSTVRKGGRNAATTPEGVYGGVDTARPWSRTDPYASMAEAHEHRGSYLLQPTLDSQEAVTYLRREDENKGHLSTLHSQDLIQQPEKKEVSILGSGYQLVQQSQNRQNLVNLPYRTDTVSPHRPYHQRDLFVVAHRINNRFVAHDKNQNFQTVSLKSSSKGNSKPQSKSNSNAPSRIGTRGKKQGVRMDLLHEPVAILQMQAINAEKGRNKRHLQTLSPIQGAIKNITVNLNKNKYGYDGHKQTPPPQRKQKIQIISARDGRQMQVPNKDSPRKTMAERLGEFEKSKLENWQKIKINNLEKFKQFQVINERQNLENLFGSSQNDGISQVSQLTEDSVFGAVDMMLSPSFQRAGGATEAELKTFNQQYQEYLQLMQSRKGIIQSSANNSLNAPSPQPGTPKRNAPQSPRQNVMAEGGGQGANFTNTSRQFKLQGKNMPNFFFQDKMNQEQVRQALTSYVLKNESGQNSPNSIKEPSPKRRTKGTAALPPQIKQMHDQQVEAQSFEPYTVQQSTDSPPRERQDFSSQLISMENTKNLSKTRTLSMKSDEPNSKKQFQLKKPSQNRRDTQYLQEEEEGKRTRQKSKNSTPQKYSPKQIIESGEHQLNKTTTLPVEVENNQAELPQVPQGPNKEGMKTFSRAIISQESIIETQGYSRQVNHAALVVDQETAQAQRLHDAHQQIKAAPIDSSYAQNRSGSQHQAARKENRMQHRVTPDTQSQRSKQTTSPAPHATGSLHEIADAQSLSAGETTTNLEPHYYDGQSQMAMMSNPDGSHGKVSPGVAKKKVVALVGTHAAGTVTDPQSRNLFENNSVDSSGVGNQRILFENQVDMGNQSGSIRKPVLENFNLKINSTGQRKDGDLSLQLNQASVSQNQPPSPASYGSFLAPLGSLPKDERYIKAIQDINNRRIQQQQINQMLQQQSQMSELLQQIQVKKNTLQPLDAKLSEASRSWKAKTPFVAMRDIRAEAGMPQSAGVFGQKRGTTGGVPINTKLGDLVYGAKLPNYQFQPLEKVNRDLHPATAVPQARFNFKRSSEQQSVEPQINFRVTTDGAGTFTDRAIVTPRTMKTADPARMRRQNVTSRQNSTQDESQHYMKNGKELLQTFLKVNKKFVPQHERLGPWPAFSTPSGEAAQEYMQPDWQECLSNLSLIKKGVPMEKLKKKNKRDRESAGQNTRNSRRQIFTNEAIMRLSKNGNGKKSPREVAERSQEGSAVTITTQTHKDIVSASDVLRDQEVELVQLKASAEKQGSKRTVELSERQGTQGPGFLTGRTQEEGGHEASKLNTTLETVCESQNWAAPGEAQELGPGSRQYQLIHFTFQVLNGKQEPQIKTHGVNQELTATTVQLTPRCPSQIKQKIVERSKEDVKIGYSGPVDITAESPLSILKSELASKDLLSKRGLNGPSDNSRQDLQPMRKFNSHVEAEEGGISTNEHSSRKVRQTVAEAMTRSGVVFDVNNMPLIDQLIAHQNTDVVKQQEKPAPVVPPLQFPKSWNEVNKKVSGTQVDASMLDDGKSPQPKFELGSNPKDTERSRVSRTIVGGNLELSNRASLEQTNGSISERVAESLAEESQIQARVDSYEGNRQTQGPAKSKVKPKLANQTENETKRSQAPQQVYTGRSMIASSRSPRMDPNGFQGYAAGYAGHHGKRVGLRGNPNKELMNNKTKDGRNYTTSLVRPSVIKEVEHRIAVEQLETQEREKTQMEMTQSLFGDSVMLEMSGQPIRQSPERLPMKVEKMPQIVDKKESPYATPVRRARADKSHSPLIASKNSPALSPGKADFMSPRFGQLRAGRGTMVLDEPPTEHAVAEVMTVNNNSPHGSELAPSMVQRVVGRKSSGESAQGTKGNDVREINLKKEFENTSPRKTQPSRNSAIKNGLEQIQTLDKEELKSYLQQSRQQSGVGAVTVNNRVAAKTTLNQASRESYEHTEPTFVLPDKKWRLTGDLEGRIAEIDSNDVSNRAASKAGEMQNGSSSSRQPRQNIFIQRNQQSQSPQLIHQALEKYHDHHKNNVVTVKAIFRNELPPKAVKDLKYQIDLSYTQAPAHQPDRGLFRATKVEGVNKVAPQRHLGKKLDYQMGEKEFIEELLTHRSSKNRINQAKENARTLMTDKNFTSKVRASSVFGGQKIRHIII